MILKEFKIALIRYTRTVIPKEYDKVLRIPGTASSDELILRTKSDSITKQFCEQYFGTTSKSFKINRNEEILGEQIIQSFRISSERNNEEVTDIFNVDEQDFLELEKERIDHNLKIAFENPKSELFDFMETAIKSGLVEDPNTDLPALLKEFQDTWPIEKLKSMTLEEYTNLDKTSFCYWLEAITYKLGSVWGGSSYKFGIFERRDRKSDNYNKKRKSDGRYAWYGKYGDNKEEVFEKLRTIIIEIATYSQENRLEDIDGIDLGDAIKWKVAFLYSDYNIINIFNHKALGVSAAYLGYEGVSHKYSDLNRYVISQQGDKDFFEFAKELWGVFSKDETRAKEFEKWLKENQKEGSGKVSSYLNAIKILTSHFEIAVYDEEETEVLEDLYEDLKLNQNNEEGKYFYAKAPSYGKNGYYSAAIGAYIEFVKSGDLIEKQNVMEKSQPLNQILFGPPGTGKTYHTINKALSIIENKPEDIINNEDREELTKRFKAYIESERIVFTTFHQSMSYEDFVEGIKPDTNEDGGVVYDVEEGIFKRLCEKAKVIEVDTSGFDWSNRKFYKMSLGGKREPHVHSWCLVENKVALGYGGDEDLLDISEIDNWPEYREAFKRKLPEVYNDKKYNAEVSFRFLKMKKGDIVIASMGNHIIDAIGVVDGPYEFDPENESTFPHTRKVKWLSKNMKASPSRFFRKNISQQSVYEFYDKDVILESFEELTNVELKGERKNYVMIIDEINRGNVSSIFGELITLIEKDKRLGAKEELEVVLPYSKDPFGVPSNLFIIGTMNTADRSVEALDTALRRRFSFVEMLPNASLLSTVANIDLKQLLLVLNERIEVLVDRDHTIGHAFFINAKSLKDIQEAFANKVIPLLQEYFYGDYKKIELVIGALFFEEKKDVTKVSFAVSLEDVFEGNLYVIKNVLAMDKPKFIEALKGIGSGIVK